MPAKKQLKYIQNKGIILGTRMKNERKVFLYLLSDFFVEILYQQDRSDYEPEQIITFSDLKNLNGYLEKEFKAAF